MFHVPRYGYTVKRVFHVCPVMYKKLALSENSGSPPLTLAMNPQRRCGSVCVREHYNHLFRTVRTLSLSRLFPSRYDA
eukprot:6178172-Pleurochrysis_carterae.AAC.1